MAEEQASTEAAAAQTAVSSPLSSQSQSQSTSEKTAAQTDGSTKTQSSQDGTITQKTTTEQAAARPEGIPDTYWDSAANSLKVDPVVLAKDLKERDDLKTFKAAEDVKAASRPQKPDDYKLELPADFKMPPGVEYKLDTANPAFTNLRAVAHKHGLTQDAVNELIGVYAGDQMASDMFVKNRTASEIAKLGSTGGARVDNVINWLSGMDSSADKGDAKALAATLVGAVQVEAFERLITKITSQGTASFSQSHRAAPETGIPGYDKMSFEQRRAAQDRNASARRTA